MRIWVYISLPASCPPYTPRHRLPTRPHSLPTVRILRVSAPLAAYSHRSSVHMDCSLHYGPAYPSFQSSRALRFLPSHRAPHRTICNAVHSSLYDIWFSIPHSVPPVSSGCLPFGRSRLYLPVAKAPCRWLAQSLGLLASTSGVFSK